VGPTIDPAVFAAVLAAAAMHAGWNAALKVRIEPVLGMTLIAAGSSVAALPLVIAFGPPRAAAWPWLLGSVTVHLGYYTALAEAYRRADLGQMYPIARGAAPLLTALASFLFLGEALVGRAVAGVAVLSAGVALMSVLGRRQRAPLDLPAVGMALLTAATVSAYTVCDGMGARTAGSAHSYAATLFLVNSLPITVWVAWRRGPRALLGLRPFVVRGLVGGALSLGSYWIAIWAMTVAPIALVAGLRESSVLFASALGVVVLKEPVLPVRLLAALAIVVGLALMKGC
jgi:drug/metabolite transporter (DMT)-like permease